MTDTTLMRDAFIDHVYEAARLNRSLVFISADFGAKALDRFRVDLPQQFIHAGIAEQNMVDLAAGLAIAGKQVMLYAMAPFLTSRCYEQIKAVLCSMKLPIALVGVGAGLGYDHATLTHFTPEDIATTKALNHMEVWSPADAACALTLARLTVEHPALRYIRLERQPMEPIRTEISCEELARGYAELARGKHVCLLACGYLVHKLLRARRLLTDDGIDAGVIDLFRIKPLSPELMSTLASYQTIVTVEEQLLEGGFGSGVLEAMAAAHRFRPIMRLGLRDGFEVANGNRDELHQRYKIDTADIVDAARNLVKIAA